MKSPNLPGEIQMRSEEQGMYVQPENKLLGKIRVVEKAMRHLNCTLHQGDIYHKPEASKYTYVYYKNVTDFLHQLSANPKMAETLVGHITPIANMLNNPSSYSLFLRSTLI